MPENFTIYGNTKTEKYESLIIQLRYLVEGEKDIIANLSNCSSIIKYGFDFFWVGFYLVKQHELVLGPFQGTVACSRIQKGKGVCGKAWEIEKTILVDDVTTFPGHIACSNQSKSEIVIPIKDKNNTIVCVLDIDDDKYGSFDETDQIYLEQICTMIGLWF